MTSTSPILVAPPLEQLAPHVAPRVRDGDLKTAPLVLLGAGALLVALSWITGGHDFYFSYLVGYMGVLGVCLGALFFVMLQHIVRAGWSVSLRRIAENISACLPLMLLLFAPILVGFDDLFGRWAAPELVDPADARFDPLIAGKSAYLNKPFFLGRVGIYFAIWIGLAWFFRRTSLRQDETGDPALSLRMSRVAAPGLLLFALSITFAAFDWIMSLDPHWFSTIFGVTYFAGSYMAFLAFVILLAKWLGGRGYLREAITVEHYHDLGKLLFAFMIFWTYTNFAQYMLIWYANLPEETRWFDVRQQNGWGAVGTILVFGHFFVPFAYLMSRHVKRNSVALSAGAIFMLLVHCIDMQFLIVPNNTHGAAHAAEGHGEAPVAAASAVDPLARGLDRFAQELPVYLHNVHWQDFACFAALLAVVAGATLLTLRRTNLLPVRDPRLVESLHFENQ